MARGLNKRVDMYNQTRQRRSARGSAPLMVVGKETPKEAPKQVCAKKDLRFWLRRGRRVYPSLPSLAYVIFLQNPIVASWWLMLIVLAWVGLFFILQETGVLILPMIDNTVPALIIAAVTFLSSGVILGNGISRRGNNISNYKSLVSAVYNLYTAIEASIDYPVWRTKPKVKIPVHYNHMFADAEFEAMQVTEQISWLLISILAGQRNVLRGGFDARRLPLEPELISEVYRRQKITPGYDPLVTMQQMVLTRIMALTKAGAFLASEDLMHTAFFKDMVDSLGNVAIQASARTPRVFQVFYWFFLALWIIYMPFWLLPLYPSWLVLIAAPLSIVFFTASATLGERMPDIFVSSSENYWSDFNLVKEMSVGAESIDATFNNIWSKVSDPMAPPPSEQAPPPVTQTPAPAASRFFRR